MVGQRNVTGSIVVALGLLLLVWETVREHRRPHDDVIIAPPRGGYLPVGRISHVSAKNLLRIGLTVKRRPSSACTVRVLCCCRSQPPIKSHHGVAIEECCKFPVFSSSFLELETSCGWDWTAIERRAGS